MRITLLSKRANYYRSALIGQLTMSANSKRQHIPFNSSVYAPISQCDFIPSCAYELPYKTVKLAEGEQIELYITDDKKHIRARYIKAGIGLSGLVFESKSKRVVYGETMPAHRRQGIYKNLKAYLEHAYKLNLWSDYQSTDYLQAFNR
jgi:hypothetical protein